MSLFFSHRLLDAIFDLQFVRVNNILFLLKSPSVSVNHLRKTYSLTKQNITPLHGTHTINQIYYLPLTRVALGGSYIANLIEMHLAVFSSARPNFSKMQILTNMVFAYELFLRLVLPLDGGRVMPTAAPVQTALIA